MKIRIQLIVFLVFSIFLFTSTDSFSQKKSKKSSEIFGNYSYTTKSSKKNTKSNDSYNYTPKKTKEKTSTTNYIYGETYKTTGNTKVKRNSTAKKEFLKKNGYNNLPYGYEVDHIKPLSEGGTDTPDNMQLITKESHKIKTADERHLHKKKSYDSPPKKNKTGISKKHSKKNKKK
jgi:hypothetical protein